MKLDGQYFYEQTHVSQPDGRRTWAQLTAEERTLLNEAAEVTRSLLLRSAMKYRELINEIIPDYPQPNSEAGMDIRHQHAVSTIKKLRATETAVELANIIKDGS